MISSVGRTHIENPRFLSWCRLLRWALVAQDVIDLEAAMNNTKLKDGELDGVSVGEEVFLKLSKTARCLVFIHS